MNQRAPWTRYLNMPYRWNGDPDRDASTDCFRVTLAVLALHGAPRPAVIERRWYAAAGRNRWKPLLRELDSISRPVAGGRHLDVALLGGGAPIALGVCVAGGLLTASQGQGVHWRPLAACSIRRWFEFLPAAPVAAVPNLLL
jgi:hypothetical protein